MTSLRTLATACALLIGLGGVWAALQNLPALPQGVGPAPGYLLTNLIGGVVVPFVVCLAAGTALLLLARIDRRLERLEAARSD